MPQTWAAVVSCAALPLFAMTSPAVAGPCTQDIALLDKQLTDMGVNPAADAKADAINSATNNAGGMPPPGISAAKGVTTLPQNSAANPGNTLSGSQEVDARALTALNEARRADIQGDSQKCKDAVQTVRKYLKN